MIVGGGKTDFFHLFMAHLSPLGTEIYFDGLHFDPFRPIYFSLVNPFTGHLDPLAIKMGLDGLDLGLFGL